MRLNEHKGPLGVREREGMCVGGIREGGLMAFVVKLQLLLLVGRSAAAASWSTEDFSHQVYLSEVPYKRFSPQHQSAISGVRGGNEFCIYFQIIVCYKWCCKWTFELTNYSASIWEKMSKNKKCGAGFIKNALHKNLYNLKIIVFTNCKNTVIFEEFVTSECKCNSFFTLCSYHRSNF